VPNWQQLLAQMPLTLNAVDLTEQAAVAVMAILISHLENAQILVPLCGFISASRMPWWQGLASDEAAETFLFGDANDRSALPPSAVARR
jgi:hypothetical protein